MPPEKAQKGFTLIELLVVIAIIGVLSSVVLASLNEARDRAKYAKLYTDLRQIESALNLARNDYNDWPSEGASYWGGTLQTIWDNNQNNFSSYISEIPITDVPEVTISYQYDKDADAGYVDLGCETSPDFWNWSSGTNLVIRQNVQVGSNLTLFNNLNEVFDQGEDTSDYTAAAGCGKIRARSDGADSAIIYSLDR
jgi:type II secretion system protein G